MSYKMLTIGIIVIAFIALVVIGALAMWQGAGEKSATPSPSIQGTRSFMEKYTQTENAVLVDVRSPEEFETGHIEGAVNVNFYDPTFAEAMKKLGTDKSFFIYCRSGGRSGQAVALLTKEGLVVEDLKGGISAHPELLN